MKWLKGPRLTMPNVKAPPMLADLYWDLRDRRLLPLVALAVIAIAAAPFLLGGGSDEAAPPPGAPVTGGSASEAARAASLTVVEANPGLRDYRKRLAGRTPTDPFHQRYTAPSRSGAVLGSESGNSSGSTVGTVTTDPATSGPSTTGTTVTSSPPSAASPDETSSGGGNAGGDGDGQSELSPGSRLFGFRPDVQFGVAGSNDLAKHDELHLGGFLPRKDPILIFIGVTQNGKRALFDVSPQVASVQGEGACVGGVDNCRILSLEEGQAVTLRLESSQTFRLVVVRIRFVEIDVPKKADSSSIAPLARGPVVSQFEAGPD